MADRYDVIVIGAGHNGLTLAARVAEEGRRVLVLERREVWGGICAGEEFRSGYRTAGLLHDTTHVRLDVLRSLGLLRRGLVPRGSAPPVLLAQKNGRGLLLQRDPRAAAAEIAAHSPRDAERYREYRAFFDRIGPVVRRFLQSPLPDLTQIGSGDLLRALPQALALRRLGARTMADLVRAVPQSLADWLGERFEGELLRSGLAAPALLGTFFGPRSPGGTANLVFTECGTGPGIQGGPTAVVGALSAAVLGYGVEIRTGAPVHRVVVERGKVTGVLLAGEERIEAPAVAASCDPRHAFLDLMVPTDLPGRLEQRVRGFRARGTTAKVHLALSAPLRFACRPDLEVEFARTGESLDDHERAFDAVKYGEIPAEPVLDVHVPSLSNPSLAPSGHAVVSILAHFVPHDLDGGWDDEARERLGDLVVEALEAYAPGVKESVVAREVLTPADLEARYGLTGGHVHHGEHAIDQRLMRPVPGCAGYGAPVPGLYLCGSGSHPGGGVTCAPGFMAAGALLSA